MAESTLHEYKIKEVICCEPVKIHEAGNAWRTPYAIPAREDAAGATTTEGHAAACMTCQHCTESSQV